jgi:Domain of unknown function (DUF5753)
MDGGFSILGFPEPTDPDVVYLENQAGSLYLEEAPEIDRYARMFSHLMAKALDPDESRRMISRVAKDLIELPDLRRCGMAVTDDLDLSRAERLKADARRV